MDMNKDDRFGRTPFHYVCSNKDNEHLIQYLIEFGADIHKVNNDGDTPLIIAVRKNNENIIKCLVEYGANVNVENEAGETPFSIASKKKNVKIKDYLVEHGAYIVNIDDEDSFLNNISKNSEILIEYLI